MSLEELVDILNQDWNGREPLRRYFLAKIPKFGNDCGEADDVATIEVSRINDFIKSHKTCFGGPWGTEEVGSRKAEGGRKGRSKKFQSSIFNL